MSADDVARLRPVQLLLHYTAEAIRLSNKTRRLADDGPQLVCALQELSGLMSPVLNHDPALRDQDGRRIRVQVDVEDDTSSVRHATPRRQRPAQGLSRVVAELEPHLLLARRTYGFGPYSSESGTAHTHVVTLAAAVQATFHSVSGCRSPLQIETGWPTSDEQLDRIATAIARQTPELSPGWAKDLYHELQVEWGSLTSPHPATNADDSGNIVRTDGCPIRLEGRTVLLNGESQGELTAAQAATLAVVIRFHPNGVRPAELVVAGVKDPKRHLREVRALSAGLADHIVTPGCGRGKGDLTYRIRKAGQG